MGESFKRFKGKASRIRLVRSLLLAAAVGFLLAGLFIFFSKFEIIAIKPILSLPIGVGAAALVGVGSFLLLGISDKALARRLDRQLQLQEKVETMLAYEHERGAIFELQREDAEKSLGAVSTKTLKFKHLWLYIILAAIGAAVLACAFVFSPEEAPPPEKPDDPFELTDIQAAAMEELIEYVNASAMASPYKEEVALALTDLLSELRAATTVPERDTALDKAIEVIYERTDASSAAVELINALWQTDAEGVKRIAELINYYEWPKADEWDTFSSELADARTALIHPDTLSENPDGVKMAKDTAVLLVRIASNVQASLTRAGIASDDPLYVALTRLATENTDYGNGTHLWGLSPLSEKAESIGYEMTQRELDTLYTVIGAEIFGALEAHSASTGTGEYALTRLKELFSVKIPAFERPNLFVSNPETPGGDEGGGDEGGGGGGIGSGAVYGSDDMVLDPMTNTYVEYGEILDKYYALMFAKQQDGNYTDAEKEAMEKYFAILYDGFDDENND